MNPIAASNSFSSLIASRTPEPAPQLTAGKSAEKAAPSAEELKEQFTQFVGETFFGQMIKAMRNTQEKPAYFHGGRGEEIFQGQLDQMLTEQLTESSAEQFSEPMFELFQLNRHA